MSKTEAMPIPIPLNCITLKFSLKYNFETITLQSIESMVETAHMSNTYFRKLFCAKFSVTPVRYLISKRLLYAEKLLSTGKYTIKEVAEKSGFCDVKYFSRLVKKEYGVPPSKLYKHIIRQNTSKDTTNKYSLGTCH